MPIDAFADLALIPTTACKLGRGTPLTDHAVSCLATLAMTGDIMNSCGSGWSLCASSPTTPEACADRRDALCCSPVYSTGSSQRFGHIPSDLHG